MCKPISEEHLVMTEVAEGGHEVNAAFDSNEESNVDANEESYAEEGEKPEPVRGDEGAIELPKPVREEITLDGDLYMVPNTNEDHTYMEIADPPRDRVVATGKEEGEKHAGDPEAVGMEAVLLYRTAIKTTTETTFIKYECMTKRPEKARMIKNEESWCYESTTNTTRKKIL